MASKEKKEVHSLFEEIVGMLVIDWSKFVNLDDVEE